MIRLKPSPDNPFTCPECGTGQPMINEIKFETINILADCTCTRCNSEFYQVLPVGHAVESIRWIGKINGKVYPMDTDRPWLSASLLSAHTTNRNDVVDIERIIFKKFENIVILNTLDSLYGHVLLKLYNAFYHLDHQKEIGLVIIVPKIFKWLIPQGCAEAWIVDLPLGDMVYGYESIQNFISSQFSRFREIYISKAYSHPEFSTVDIERLTGIPPFDLQHFSTEKPVVTFVLREDRWWFNSTAEYWLYRVCRRLKALSWGVKVLSLRQNELIKKTIKVIRKELPQSQFFVVGLGKTGSFEGYATDERQTSVDAAVEAVWCRRYARSHVVIGIHGSNMLLPTAMAAGCVEVLPEDRYGNMIQDISVRYTDRRQLFFYRFVDQYANPNSVGQKAISIIRDYSSFHENMCRNVYPPKPSNDGRFQVVMTPVIEKRSRSSQF